MECISIFLIAHTVLHCGWLIIIALLLTVTVVTVITTFLYWRCCCYLSSDCSVFEVNIHRNAGASEKLLIWKVGRAELQIIYNLCSV